MDNQTAVLHSATSYSLSFHIDPRLPLQPVKGLSAFRRGGQLTDSAAQKKATGAKGQGSSPARQRVGVAPLHSSLLFFPPVDVEREDLAGSWERGRSPGNSKRGMKR